MRATLLLDSVDDDLDSLHIIAWVRYREGKIIVLLPGGVSEDQAAT